VALRIDDGRLEEALELTQELERRGEPIEAARLAMALAVGIRKWEVAATRAESLGLSDIASRIRGRAAIEEGGPLMGGSLADGVWEASDAMALVVTGEVALAQEMPLEALDRAALALAEDPWLPEALDLQVRALEATGGDAREARARLRAADPSWVVGGDQGPITAAGSTGTSVQVHSEVP
jgi:hypothetical protein